jgi:hypothetical protein
MYPDAINVIEITSLNGDTLNWRVMNHSANDTIVVQGNFDAQTSTFHSPKPFAFQASGFPHFITILQDTGSKGPRPSAGDQLLSWSVRLFPVPPLSGLPAVRTTDTEAANKVNIEVPYRVQPGSRRGANGDGTASKEAASDDAT